MHWIYFSFQSTDKSAVAHYLYFIWHHMRANCTHFLSLLSPSSSDSQTSPLVRGGLLGSVRLPQSSATCMSWGGAHYRTFDRKHFHFQGSCTYLLASSTDGTWAVYISTVCDRRGNCSKVWNMADSMDGWSWWSGIISGILFYTFLSTSHNVAVVSIYKHGSNIVKLSWKPGWPALICLYVIKKYVCQKSSDGNVCWFMLMCLWPSAFRLWGWCWV